MRRFVLAAAAVTLGATSLLAADLPRPTPYAAPPPPAPVYNWSGVYIGANGGYGFANTNRTATLSGNPFVDGTVVSTGNNLNGFVGGGQIGVNWQWNALVLGIEGDIQGTGQSKTETVSCGFLGCITEDAKIPWFATFRARAGVAVDRVLFYGTGGVAWLEAKDTLTAAAGGISATVLDLSDTRTGWTAGAGVEVAFADNWTARVEYLFVDVSPSATGTVPAALGGGTVTENATIKDNIIRAGINFKFTPF